MGFSHVNHPFRVSLEPGGETEPKSHHFGVGLVQNHPKMGVSMTMGVPQNGWFIRENPLKIIENR